MAQAPTEKQVEKNLEQSRKLEADKLQSQAKQGKAFINHGQGVIPEKIWKTLPGKQEEK